MSTKSEDTLGNIIVWGFAAFVLALVLYAAVYICVSVSARNSCHAAGWMNQKIDMNFTRYCYSRIQGSDIIVPYEEAVKNGNQTNLYIREVFNVQNDAYGHEQEASTQ